MRAAVVLVALLLAPLLVSAAGDCKLSLTGGVEDKTYDFSKLVHPSGNWQVLDLREDGKYTYEINVCGPLASTGQTTACLNKQSDVAACQILTVPDSANTAFPHLLGSVRSLVLRDSTLVMQFAQPAGSEDKEKCSNGVRSTEIRFSCGDGLGEPKFVEETTSCTYVFDWETSVVCEDQTGNNGDFCSLVYDGNEYNLNPLTRSDQNWEIFHTTESDEYTYFINVCNTLVKDDRFNTPKNSCTGDGETEICQVKAATFAESLGHPSDEGLQYDADKDILYMNFHDGSPCGDSGTARESTIYFRCGQTLGNPTFLFEDKCHYIFDWETSAACPIKGSTSTSTCAVRSPVTGHDFDFSPIQEMLQRDGVPGLTFKTLDGTGWINLCGTSQCGSTLNAFACFVPDQGQPQVLATAASRKLYLEDGDIILIGSIDDKSIEVSFVCDKFSAEPLIELVRKSGSDYLFRLYTPLACAEQPVDCVATDDQNREYDLTPLSLSHGQWVVTDDRELDQYKYVLNVCRGVNRGDSPCDEDWGVCQLKMSSEDGTTYDPTFRKNVGKPTGPPKFVDGALVIEMENGETCNSNQHQRKSTITFICNPSSLGEPEFEHEDPDTCHYYFVWPTSAACPLHEVDTGDCTAVDATTQETIDLSPLMNLDFSTKTGEETYYVGVCGHPVHECSEPSGVAGVCVQHGEDRSVAALSEYNKSPGFDQDGLYMEYRSMQDGFTTRVTFTCAPGLTPDQPQGDKALKLITKTDSHLLFELRTSLACRSTPEPVDCIVYDNLHRQVDLTRLMKPRGNYVVQGDDHVYQINICRALEPVAGSTCPHNAAACQLMPDSTRSDNSLGRPSSPVWDPEQKRVVLRYTNGTGSCHGVHQRTTQISFICANSSQPEGKLEYLGETDDCTYEFVWITHAACPVHYQPGAGDCVVYDPFSGNKIDLKPLKKQDGYMITSGQYKYHINVCDDLNHNGDAAGAWQTDSSASTSDWVNLGKSSQQVHFENGVLTLNYAGGKACHSDTFQRSTTIYFVCDPSQKDAGQPVFRSEAEDCTYIFEWRTAYACNPDIDCTATDNGALYDLSSLRNDEHNWVVADDRENGKYEYEINVCRALVPNPDGGWACDAFGASCQKTKDGNFYDLGYPTGPTVDRSSGEPILVLEYPNGQDCHGKPRKTRIEFECPKNSLGNVIPGLRGVPEFERETTDCTYLFRWRTSAACAETTEIDFGTCTVVDPLSGEHFDLNSLKSSNGAGYTVLDDKYTYVVDPCSETAPSKCHQGDGACQIDTTASPAAYHGLGKTNKTLEYEDNAIVMRLRHGETCHNNQYERATKIVFNCEHSAGIGRPTFIEETDECEYFFEWYTALACHRQHEIQCVVQGSNGHLVDLSPLTTTTYHQAGSLDGDSTHNLYINICRSVGPDTKFAGCDGAACLVDSKGQIKPVGQLQQPPVISEGAIKLTYGNVPCPIDSKTKTATTIITFLCSGYEDSGPAVTSVISESCTYEVEWTTPYACISAPTTQTTTTTTRAGQTHTTPNPAEPHYADCKVTTNDGEVLDFSPLGKSDQGVSTSEGVLNFRLCGPVQTGSCSRSSGCIEGDNSNVADSLGPFSYDPVFVEETGEVVFESVPQPLSAADTSPDRCTSKRLRVTLTCGGTFDKTMPRYLDKEAEDDGSGGTVCTYSVHWTTLYACSAPEPIDCRVYDNGKVYDLSRLARTGSGVNWVATSSGDDTFYINVCRAVNYFDGIDKCQGAAACRKPSSGATEPLGYAANPPRALPNSNALALTYDMPPSSTNDNPPSVLVTFSCKLGTLGKPEFSHTTPENMYVFTWETSVACDTSNKNVGDKCAVRDPVTGNSFDVSALAGDQTVSTPDKGTFSLAVCQPFSQASPCGTANSGLGSCQKLSDGTNAAGNANSKLTLHLDKLFLEYTGGADCHKDKATAGQRSTFIEFACGEDSGGPEFLYEAADCTYYFRWTTPHACAAPQVECVVRDNQGHTIDLSSLTLEQGNWEVVNRGKLGFDYRLNVCHGLNPDPVVNRGCDPRAGVCQLEDTNNNTHFNLGQVAAPKIDSNGKVTITYENGDMCGGKPRSTVITFNCASDKNHPLGEPVMHEETTECHYEITWDTVAACPVTTHNEKTCKFTHDISGFTFDLTSLKASNVKDDRGLTYNINPCGTAQCGGVSDSMICQTAGTNAFSLGKLDHIKVTGTEESPTAVLITTGGSLCHNKYPRSAAITFVCDPEAGDGQPRFVAEDDQCNYEFLWATATLCPPLEPVECVVHDPHTGLTLDLSQLRQTSVKGDNGQHFAIGVCGPADAQCGRANAAVCLLQDQGPSTAVGLFSPSTVPKLSSDGHIVVSYNKVVLDQSLAGLCEHGRNVETAIEFIPKCNGHYGSPVLEGGKPKPNAHADGCIYHFTWETCAVCRQENPCAASQPTTRGGGSTKKTTKEPSNAHGAHTTKSSPSSAGVAVAVVLVIVIVVAVSIFYLRDPERRSKVMSMCRRRVAPKYVYHRAAAEDGAPLYEDGESDLEDEDDQLLPV